MSRKLGLFAVVPFLAGFLAISQVQAQPYHPVPPPYHRHHHIHHVPPPPPPRHYHHVRHLPPPPPRGY